MNQEIEHSLFLNSPYDLGDDFDLKSTLVQFKPILNITTTGISSQVHLNLNDAFSEEGNDETDHKDTLSHQVQLPNVNPFNNFPEPEALQHNQVVFNITKSRRKTRPIKSLTIKSKIIFLKSHFLKNLKREVTAGKKYLNLVEKRIKEKKQDYSKGHIEFFLSRKIKSEIRKALEKLSDKEKDIGLNLLSSKIWLGNNALTADHTFNDYDKINKITTDAFCGAKKSSKYGQHRKKQLSILLNNIYGRTISKEVLFERTKKNKEKREEKKMHSVSMN